MDASQAAEYVVTKNCRLTTSTHKWKIKGWKTVKAMAVKHFMADDPSDKDTKSQISQVLLNVFLTSI